MLFSEPSQELQSWGETRGEVGGRLILLHLETGGVPAEKEEGGEERSEASLMFFTERRWEKMMTHCATWCLLNDAQKNKTMQRKQIRS